MRLALLGADEETLGLIRWAVRAGGHELVAAYDVGTHESDVAAIAPQAELNDTWEALVLGTQVDGVVVARGLARVVGTTGIPDEERRAEQLRKLAQAAVPMLVVCPACEAIVGFEIEMICKDSRGVIVPLVPGANHPAIADLHTLVAYGQSPIGKVEQIVFERAMADRSRLSVLAMFARDAAVLRQLIGTIRSVSAAGPAPAIGRDPLGPKPHEPPPLANLSVHVSGDEGLTARWSVIPATSSGATRITAIGQNGAATLQITDDEWKLDVTGPTPATTTYPRQQGFAEVLWKLSHSHSEEFRDDDAWLAACRDQEAAEAIDRSLARGRTIELFNEEHSEEESFKGVMAMGGCLLLVGALGVVFMATVVEGLRLPLRDWAVWRYWPVYLLVPIVVFLLLQLLQIVVKKEVPQLRHLVGSEDRAN